MARVIPDIKNSNNQQNPNWLDVNEIVAAGQKELQESEQLIGHLASIKENLQANVISYSCGCGKVFQASHPSLLKQASLAKKTGQEVQFKCPDCGQILDVYSSAVIDNIDRGSGKYADSFVTEKDLHDKTASGTVNTFVDSHLVYRAIQTLQRFAMDNGAIMARVKYINSEHKKIAGQSYPTLNNINCEIEWTYAGLHKMNDPALTKKGHVVATISIDPAGKFVLPTTLKIANGKEYPFNKDTFENLHKNVEYSQIQNPIAVDLHGAILQPTYRRPDPTRFRAAGLKSATNENEGGGLKESRFNLLTKKKLSKSAYNIEALRENLISMLQKASNLTLDNASKSASDVESWISFHSEYPTEKIAFLPQQPMLQITSEINDGIYDKDLEVHAGEFLVNPSFSSKQSKEANIGMPQTPNPGQTSTPYQPNQQVLNPADGKAYNVQQDTPGQGITVVDPTTQTQSVIPENERGNIRPVLNTDPNQTTTTAAFSLQAIADDIIREHLHGDATDYKNMINKNMDMVNDDIEEIRNNPDEFGDEYDEIKEHEDLIMDSVNSIVEDEDLLGNMLDTSSGLKKQTNLHVHEMSSRWQEIRSTLRTGTGESKVTPVVDVTKESRQVRAARELGFKPLKADPDKKGHDKKTNIPVGEKGKFEVGMTEFPKDQKRDDNVGYPASPEGKGYGVTMQEMDENHVRDREHFDNERRLPVNRMRRDELKNYMSDPQGGEKNYGLDPDADAAIKDEIGMKKSNLNTVAASKAEIGHILNLLKIIAPKYKDLEDRPAVTEGAARTIANWYNAEGEDVLNIKAQFLKSDLLDLRDAATDFKEIKTVWPGYELESESSMKRGTKSKSASSAVGDDDSIPAGPVQYKDVKKAPGLEGFKEPDVIEDASGKVKEAITKFKNTQVEIDSVKENLAKKIEPINEKLKKAREPFDKEISEKESLKKSYLDMIFEQLSATEAQVVAYEDKIIATFSRVKTTQPNITLAQVMKKADEVMSDISAKISELKDILETEAGTNQLLERFVYEYPLSKAHEKKTLRSSIRDGLRKKADDEEIGRLAAWLREFSSIDSILEAAIAELEIA